MKERQFPGGIPSFATSAGLKHVIFADHFDDPSTVNMILGDTTPGYNWYQNNLGPADPSSYMSVADSILTIAAPAQGQLMSIGYDVAGGGLTYTKGNTIPSNRGMYFEYRAKFTAVPGGGHDFKPNCYMEDVDFWTQRHSGITDFSRHCIEIDLVEGRPATTNLQQVVHDWTNSTDSPGDNQTSSGGDYSGVDMSVFHTYGVHVQTMARNSGTGFLRFFVDRTQVGSDITWTSVTDPNASAECPYSTLAFFMAFAEATYQVDYVAVVVP